MVNQVHGARKGPATPADAAQHRRSRRARRSAWIALLFPLIFFLVVAIGLFAMANRRMEFFKPPAVGAATAAPLAGARPAPAA